MLLRLLQNPIRQFGVASAGDDYLWNRACHGLEAGVAHLRVENRALPAGPTAIDEIANATFFAGLMLSVPQEYGDVAKRMSVDDAKA